MHTALISLLSEGDIAAAGDDHRDYSAPELRLLSVGRLDPEKNPLLMIDILRDAARTDPRWRLEVCGDGSLADALRTRAAELGVADRLVLHGHIGFGERLWELYRSSHALLHVSLTEGMPQVLLEAFAARLPVVATAVGGVPEMAGGRGLLVPPRDAVAARRGAPAAARGPARARAPRRGGRRVRARPHARGGVGPAGAVPGRRAVTVGAVDCSILVPVLNEERFIAPMVAAMLAQRFDGPLEFVFADGGSSDRTREILRELADEDPRIRLFDNPRGSVSSGLNVALREARGTWVARMDGHTVYPAGYVADGIARLQRGDSRWISGPQRARGHNPVSRAVALALASPLGRGGSRKWSPPTRADGAPDDEFELDTGVFGGVWRRRTLLDYGGWDERWDKNEDSELAARFLRRGERLICLPSMSADYSPRDTLRGLWRQYRDYGQFRALTARHHPRSMRRSHLIAPALVVDAALAVTPGRLGTLARLGCGVYGAALVACGLQASRRAQHLGDAALVPVVLATMHGAHGAGELSGAVRYGPPWAALALAAGLGGVAEKPAVDEQAVFAPSLN